MPRHNPDEHNDQHTPTIPAQVRAEPSLHELTSSIWELRQMLVELLHRQGDDRAGARTGQLLFGKEKKIKLVEAVGMVWGRSAMRDPESRSAHEEILRRFATRGIDGIVLETVVSRNNWVTSLEAVERFCSQLGFRVVAPKRKAARSQQPGRASRRERSKSTSAQKS